jgi:hypothetical protein
LEATGWLLDLYDQPQEGVVLWLIADSGQRLRLHQPFPITFYAAGPEQRLLALQKFLHSQTVKLNLQREEQHDLFQEKPVIALAICVEQAAEQSQLFRNIARHFPDLDYYNADIQLSIRYAALHGTFALARCCVNYQEDGLLIDLQVMDTPWDWIPSRRPCVYCTSNQIAIHSMLRLLH